MLRVRDSYPLALIPHPSTCVANPRLYHRNWEREFLHTKKKISLLAVSLALVLVLLNVAPQVAFDTGVDSALPVMDLQDTASPSATPAPPGMIAYWQLNEDSGPFVGDSIPPNANGDIIGNPTWAPGVAGSCLELQENQYVEFNDFNNKLNLPELVSIEAWVYPTNVGGYHTILSNFINPTTMQYHFGIFNGRLFFKQQFGIIRNVMSLQPINPGQWYHVAVVFYLSAGSVWFYVTGNEDMQTYSGGSTNAPSHVTLGRDLSPAGPGYFNGFIDEVAVYGNILDPATIIEHYEKGLLGLGYLEEPNTPPVAVDDSYTTDEDTQLDVSAPGVLANDSDADGDPRSQSPMFPSGQLYHQLTFPLYTGSLVWSSFQLLDCQRQCI